MNERVTWLLPVKNGMPYLPETLASIEAQTWRDWEVLCWDNGSTDGTLAELHRWIPNRIPGRIIEDRPMSLGNSLAALVEAARTELCARIDADDVNYPERLAVQVEFLREHPRVALVGADIEFIDEEGRVVPGAWTQKHDDAEIRWRLRWKNAFGHPTVIFRRSVVLAAGNYADCMPFEDHDLWLRIALIAEMANLPRVLLKYRLLSSSVTAVRSRDYDSMFDRMAERNAAILFPGMGASEALELRRKLTPRSGERIEVGDVIRLRKAATSAAVAAGMPPSYFRSTRIYSRQQRVLLRKLLEQNALGRAALAAKRKIQYALRGDRTPPAGAGNDPAGLDGAGRRKPETVLQED